MSLSGLAIRPGSQLRCSLWSSPFSDSQQRAKIFRCGALTDAGELALSLIRCDCNHNANVQPTSTTRVRDDEVRKGVSIHCIVDCRFLYSTIACLRPNP